MQKPLYAFVIAATLLASVVSAAAGSADDSKTNDPNQIVCKPGVAPIGSHIPGPRMCHTRREWDEMTAQAHQDMERLKANRPLKGT